MRIALAAAAAIAFFGTAAVQCPARAGAPDVGSVSAILTDFQQNTTQAEFDQLRTAIASSPSLKGQLEGLAKTGRLKRIELVTANDPRLSEGQPFAARATGNEIIMTAAFLQDQMPRRLFDVVIPGDVLPDNLVFALGHLAEHLENPLSLEPSPHSFEEFKKLKLADEARAYIVGWNDMVEGAIGGATPSIPLVGSVLMNFRYRPVFIKALNTDHDLLLASGKIELNQHNLDTVGMVLESSVMPDFD